MLTQKKPYICNNLNKCDVRIVIDMSGIKRKGARCQACRYAACLDAGMFHSGANPSPTCSLRRLLIQLFAQILFLIFTVHSVYYHKNCYNIINATHAGHTYQAINKQIQEISKKV